MWLSWSVVTLLTNRLPWWRWGSLIFSPFPPSATSSIVLSGQPVFSSLMVGLKFLPSVASCSEPPEHSNLHRNSHFLLLPIQRSSLHLDLCFWILWPGAPGTHTWSINAEVSNTIPSPQETDEGNQTKYQFKKQTEFISLFSCCCFKENKFCSKC